MLLESVMAVYPYSYRGVDEMRRAVIINEWQTSLAKYPADVCARAWQKYKTTFEKARELNLAMYIGVIKDVQEADRREATRERQLLEEPKREPVKHVPGDARDQFLKKCEQVFGREFARNAEGYGEYRYTYRCPKCFDSGIIAFKNADGDWFGRKCTCDYFERQRREL